MPHPTPKFSFNERAYVCDVNNHSQHLLGKCGVIVGICDPNDYNCPDEDIVIGYALTFENERYTYFFDELQLRSCCDSQQVLRQSIEEEYCYPRLLTDVKTDESARSADAGEFRETKFAQNIP